MSTGTTDPQAPLARGQHAPDPRTLLDVLEATAKEAGLDAVQDGRTRRSRRLNREQFERDHLPLDDETMAAARSLVLKVLG